MTPVMTTALIQYLIQTFIQNVVCIWICCLKTLHICFRCCDECAHNSYGFTCKILHTDKQCIELIVHAFCRIQPYIKQTILQQSLNDLHMRVHVCLFNTCAFSSNISLSAERWAHRLGTPISHAASGHTRVPKVVMVKYQLHPVCGSSKAAPVAAELQ